MTASLIVTDVLVYSLQLAVVVAAGAASWRALGVRHPGVALGYWRALLFACLLLPVCQPWRVQDAPALEATAALLPAVERVESAALVTPSTTDPDWSINSLLLLLVGGGVIARLLWLVIAAFSLRRLRRTAIRLEPLPSPIQSARARIMTSAAVFVSDRVTGPITFGFSRPAVVVPRSVLSLNDDVQEAIASHEFLHVARRDWLSVVGEELIRTVLWFHPAIWWLIGRIQLTREHVVDDGVIELTKSRDRYVEALLAVAVARTPALIIPAPLFLRRRLLKRRLAHILQETTMTTRRLIASVAVSAAALALTAVFVVRAFPLEAQAPQQTGRAIEAGSGPVQIVRGGEHLLHASMPEYPRRAIEQKLQGDVDVAVSIDDRGEVVDARVLNGPEEFRRATLQAVLQWHYAATSVSNREMQVTLRFRVPTETEEPRERKLESNEGEMSTTRIERQMMEIEKAMQDASVSATEKEEYKHKYAALKASLARMNSGNPEAAGTDRPWRLVQIRSERVPQEVLTSVMRQVKEQFGVGIGDTINEVTAKRMAEAVRAIDEHLEVRYSRTRNGDVVMTIIAP